MIEITSKTNDRIKHLKKLLADKAYRYDQKRFVVEGVRALDGINGIVELYIREDAKPPEIKSTLAYSVRKDVFETISATENSQGVIAVAKMNLLAPASILPGARYVLLDKIQDPGNMGTIIRTACALGFKGVVITPGCVDTFSPKAARAAAGSLWKVDVIKIETIEELAPFTVIAADRSGRDVSGFEWPKGFLLCIGNEGAGLSDEVRRSAKASISIPIGVDMESLNASVSAGILMYLASTKPQGNMK